MAGSDNNRVSHGLVSNAYARGFITLAEADRAHAMVDDNDTYGLSNLLLGAATRHAAPAAE